MVNFPDTLEMKKQKEQPVSEMKYESQLDWRYMKRLRSETTARHWHIKVDSGKISYRNQPVYDDYNILQVWVPRYGERISAYKATRSGRAEDISKKNQIFEKIGANHLHGIEYLLRHLAGEDISDLQLPRE